MPGAGRASVCNSASPAKLTTAIYQVPIQSRPRTWGCNQQRDQLDFLRTLCQSFSMPARSSRCLCQMHTIHNSRPHSPPLRRNGTIPPWCFGNDVYTYKFPHSYTRIRTYTRSHWWPPIVWFLPLPPCWRSDRRGPLLVSYFEPKGAGDDKDRQAASGSKNSSLSDGNDTSCAVVAQQTKPSSGWPVWAIV